MSQVPTGNLFGTVSDEDGRATAGATVTLSGLGATQTQVTDPRGQFRFLALDPGRYTLQAELEGFSSIEYPDIDIRAGRNTTIPLVVQSALQETITVTSESPLLDEREMSEGTTVTQIELEKIPTARDPWALLTQTPGVLVDRVNVGGNESGQQAVFRAPGVESTQNDWVLDGIQISDMEAGGATTTYFDFDQFAEIRYTTGGTDVTKNTSGVSVNLVTKRGSNEFRGSARFYDTKAQGYFGGVMEQAQVNVGPEDMGPGQDIDDYAGAQVRKIQDIGFEAGGAVLEDRLWLWGSWAQNDIQQNVPSGAPDDTILENTSVKLNAQLSRANSFVASWNNGDKKKLGRGANFNRPPPTTWDQRGPSTYYRVEDTHVFTSNLFLTGMFSTSDLGFSVAAKGGVGPDAPEAWRRSDGVWQENYISGADVAVTDEFKLDASFFFNAGRSNHELKVGGRYREFEARSDFSWPGRDIYTYNTTSTRFVVAKRGPRRR